ncbi:hypothetical protein B0T19DRAFT_429671 [Cercophora scortea]|uniref:Nephrocystin 3-like N-terminal domain-containing protein n=1 Tax=Cercophora scortea TaxID=314031 RepID=A0AAE0IA29_9PEZI|nr:hypothetical protein B0T19DRAFT_429671 [Cercophora scortea]
MDPVSAIGLASGILSFVTFGVTLIKGGVEICKSGSLEDNATLEDVITMMQQLHHRMIPPNDDQLQDDDKQLCDLAKHSRKVAADLLNHLEKMKVDTSTGSQLKIMWKSLVASGKALVHGKEKDELERELSSCQQRLTTSLVYLTRESTGKIGSSVEANRKTLGELLESLEAFKKELQLSTRVVDLLDESVVGRLRKALDAQEDTISEIYYVRIRESLKYERMRDRVDNLQACLHAAMSAHSRTYQWIFDSETGSETDPMRTEARRAFANWLSSPGGGTFFITGKLGSGKSTLMRFLCDHAHTERELKMWTGDNKPLIRANYFFSTVVGNFQTSYEGLYRTLLHDILKQQPRMTPGALKKQWDELKKVPWQANFVPEISTTDALDALKYIIDRPDPPTMNFCLFVDGLDECKVTPMQDHSDLSKILHGWASRANVKICVASREDPALTNWFDIPDRMLKLHDLTRYDMGQYVKTRLSDFGEQGCLGAEHLKALMHDIPKKSQGIFLWVTLVIQQIRAELEIGSNIEEASTILEHLPSEMRKMLDYVVDTIIQRDRRRPAYLTFAMVKALQREKHLRLSLLAFSFLDDYLKKPAFARQKDFRYQQSSHEDMTKRLRRAKNELYAWCRGLVELSSGEKWIEPTHRPVQEYLEGKKVVSKLSVGSPKHKTPHVLGAFSELMLAKLRFQPRNTVLLEYHDPNSHTVNLNEEHAALFKLRQPHRLDRPPYDFLSGLQSVSELSILPSLETMISQDMTATIQLGKYRYRTNKVSDTWRVNIESANGDVWKMWTPLHDLIFQQKYDIAWHIFHSSLAPSTEGFLVFITVAHMFLFSDDNHTVSKGDVDFLTFVLQRSRRHLETTTRIIPSSRKIQYLFNTTFHSDDIQLSIWHHYLIFHFIQTYHRPSTSDQKLRRHFDSQEANFGLVAQSFLEAGADPHFSINVVPQWLDFDYNHQSQVNFKCGREGTLVEVTVHVSLGDKSGRQGFRWSSTTGRDWTWSLADWIRMLHIPGIKSKLLRLAEVEEDQGSESKAGPEGFNDVVRNDEHFDHESTDPSIGDTALFAGNRLPKAGIFALGALILAILYVCLGLAGPVG